MATSVPVSLGSSVLTVKVITVTLLHAVIMGLVSKQHQTILDTYAPVNQATQ